MSAERWRLLRPALEELLELPEGNRKACLATWSSADPDFAAELATLLALSGESRQHLLDEEIPPALREPPIAELYGDLKGQRLGNYLLDALIGEGGMGTVWTATRADGHFDGRVAVKLLNTAIRTPEAVHRFMREGRLLAKLSHPNIARLLDAGVSQEGMPFLVLEHVQGTAIDAWCDAHSLGLRERVRLFLGVLAAIEHSHVHLVVHRDIKPTNVLVTDDGVPKLLDFGIAGLAEPDTSPQAAASARTRTLWGGRAMTLQFAAPEQLQGLAATTRTDVYGMGVLLYLLLTGRHPTGLHDVASSAYVNPTIEGRLLRPGAVVQELRGDLDNILLKALKTDPAKRYASAAEFAQDLRRFLDHRPVLACPDSLAYRAARFVRRHRIATAASTIAVLAIALAGVAALRNAREARYEANRASAVNAFVRDMFGVGKTPAIETVGLRSTTVEQLLDEGTRKLQSGDDWSPEARVDLLGALADMYAALGQPAKALPLLEQRLELLKALPAGSPLAGKLLAAETLVKIAMAAGKAGLAQRREAALDEVEPVARELRAQNPAIFGQWAYETSSRRLPQDPAAAATVAAESAAAFHAAGRGSDELRALCQQAFALSRISRYPEAQSVVQQAAALVHTLKEPEPESLLYLHAIATDLDFEMLRLRGAEAHARQGLQAVIAVKGPTHPMTSRAHMRIAHALWRRGDLAGCIGEARAGVAAVEASSGSSDRRVLPQALQVLGQCQMVSGSLDDAMATLERATRLWDPAANGGLQLGSTFEGLVHVHVLRNDLAQAEAAHAQMLAAMDEKAETRKALQVAMATAALRVAQGRAGEAVRLLEPFRQKLAPDLPAGWDSVDLHVAWTRALTVAGDPRADPALRAAREFFDRTALYDEAPVLAAELISIDAAHRQSSDPAAAAQLRRAALALYEPRLNAASPVLAALRAGVKSDQALTARR